MKTLKSLIDRPRFTYTLLLVFSITLFISCEPETSVLTENDKLDLTKKKQNDGVYIFEGTVYDISAAPDGSVMVAVNNGSDRTVQVIKNGEIKTMTDIDVETQIQGIESIGSGNAFVTSGSKDLAVAGELFKVSFGGSTMIADLGAFERANDPDANEGIQWKNQQCEAVDGFSAGPQNNPYHLTAYSGSTAFIADAAGNTVLSANDDGEVDWKAILTPPLNENGDWLLRFNGGSEREIPCYVQPVPTSVALGPDGYMYIGELTGALAPEDGVFPIGRSRIWKMPADATNVTCSGKDPDGECELLIEGLTSVIDVEVGPDGLLYVVELDESSWFASFIPDVASGGTISAYDLEGNFVETVASGLEFPSAITFDKKGNLWLLENNATFFLNGKYPSVRMLE